MLLPQSFTVEKLANYASGRCHSCRFHSNSVRQVMLPVQVMTGQVIEDACDDLHADQRRRLWLEDLGAC